MYKAKHYCSLLKAGLTLCFGLLIVGSANAQRGGSASSGGRVTPDRVQAERPSAGVALTAASTSEDECDPATVIGTCPGTYSFTYGFNANASPRQGGAQTEKAGFGFAFYVQRRVFLEIDNDNVLSIRAPSGGRQTGFGDTSFYVGADAVLEGKGRPGVTLLYGIKAPTASSSKGLGSGEVDHTALVAIGKTIGSDNRTYVEFDAGDYIAGLGKSAGFGHFPFASAFLKRKLDLNGKYKLHLEVGGDFATSRSNADMYTLTYLETRLSRKDAKQFVALRTGVRVGLTPNVSRAGIYVGIKFAGNLKDVFR